MNKKIVFPIFLLITILIWFLGVKMLFWLFQLEQSAHWDGIEGLPCVVATYPIPQKPPDILSLAVVTSETEQDRIILFIQELWGDEWRTAVAIAHCESSLNEKAIGDQHLDPPSIGVFQIRAFSQRGTPEQLLNFEYNIRFAHQLYLEQDWKPWFNCALSNAVRL